MSVFEYKDSELVKGRPEAGESKWVGFPKFKPARINRRDRERGGERATDQRQEGSIQSNVSGEKAITKSKL